MYFYVFKCIYKLSLNCNRNITDVLVVLSILSVFSQRHDYRYNDTQHQSTPQNAAFGLFCSTMQHSVLKFKAIQP